MIWNRTAVIDRLWCWQFTCRILLLIILSVMGYLMDAPAVVAQTPNPDPSCPRNGDLNADGTQTPEDVLLALRYFLNNQLFPLEPCQQTRANVLAPGTTGITPSDAQCILRRFLGATSCLDPQESPEAIAVGSVTTLSAVMTTGVQELATLRNASPAQEKAATILSAKAAQEITVNCPTSGTATVRAEVMTEQSNVTLDGSVTLNDCNGLAGVLTFNGQATVGRDALTATLTLNGSISEGVCALTFNAVILQIAVDTSMASGTVSGTVAVVCGPVTTASCTWQAVPVTDEDALLAGCN